MSRRTSPVHCQNTGCPGTTHSTAVGMVKACGRGLLPHGLVALMLTCTTLLSSPQLARCDPQGEDVRKQLLQAFRAAPQIHAAMRWQIKTRSDPDQTVMTEVFRHGPLAGIHIWNADSKEDLTLALTNGKIVRMTQGASVKVATEGADAINAHLAPYVEACGFLARLWGCQAPDPLPVEVTFTLNPLQSGEKIDAGMLLISGGTPGWLTRDFLSMAERIEVEPDHRVKIMFDGATLVVRSSNSMPVSWEEHSENRSVLGREVPPSWTAKEWEAKAAALEPASDHEEGWESSCPLAGRGIMLAVNWFLWEARGQPTQVDREWQLASLIVGVDVCVHKGQRGGLLSELPHSRTLSTDADAGDPTVERVLEDTGRMLEPVMRTCTAQVDWSQEDMESLLSTFTLAYRLSFYSLVRAK